MRGSDQPSALRSSATSSCVPDDRPSVASAGPPCAYISPYRDRKRSAEASKQRRLTDDKLKAGRSASAQAVQCMPDQAGARRDLVRRCTCSPRKPARAVPADGPCPVDRDEPCLVDKHARLRFVKLETHKPGIRPVSEALESGKMAPPGPNQRSRKTICRQIT
jgi:hypothetical protein